MVPFCGGRPITKPRYFFSIVRPSNKVLNSWCASAVFANKIKPLVCWSNRCTVKMEGYFSCNNDLSEASLPNRSGILNKPAGLLSTIILSFSNNISIIKLRSIKKEVVRLIFLCRFPCKGFIHEFQKAYFFFC